MASAKTVDMFGEDEGHRAVVKSILDKVNPGLNVKYRCINRKHKILKPLVIESNSDVLILVKDANAEGIVKRRNQLSELVGESKKHKLVLCTPDPYIEKWLLLDAAAFTRVIGKGFDAPKSSEHHGYYKDFLSRSIMHAGHTTKTGLERAADIINAMDFDTIKDDSFQQFLTDLTPFLNKE